MEAEDLVELRNSFSTYFRIRWQLDEIVEEVRNGSILEILPSCTYQAQEWDRIGES